MDRLLMFIATGAGSGYLPKAPGTWGTLVGLLLWWPLAGLSLAAYLAAVPLHPVAALAGFALFRLFDIAKPFPVGWVDRHLHGGLGIMLDDVAAGLYALLVLHLGLWLLA